MKKAVILLSGGLDSTTCLALAKAQGFEVYGLSFDYGQRHQDELDCARNIAQHYAIADHKIARIDLGLFGGSALTSTLMDVPKNRSIEDTHDIPITYVPARNTIFLSFALAYAETIGAFDIFIGVNALDYSGYPDCRPVFIERFQAMANTATAAADDANLHYQIHTPLIDLTKAEIIKQGLALGVDYDMTLSCYDPQDGQACGRCDACQLRAKGFAQAALGGVDK